MHVLSIPSNSTEFSYSYLLVAKCENGEIQLAGGQSDMEGRVEICMDETWGTVCDDSWQDVSANIACRQLGFSRYSKL